MLHHLQRFKRCNHTFTDMVPAFMCMIFFYTSYINSKHKCVLETRRFTMTVVLREVNRMDQNHELEAGRSEMNDKVT